MQLGFKNFRLKVLFIWLLVLNIIALGAITAIAIIAASTRSDCSPSSSSNSTTGIVEMAPGCSSLEKLSALVNREASYFQSFHTFLSQSITTLSLIVFEPSLTAMVETSLNTGKLTVTNFGRNVDFASSPTPAYLFNYLGPRRPSFSYQVVFVVFMSAMSQVFTFMVSPIYKTHDAPFSTEVIMVNGGGIDTQVLPYFNWYDASTPRGIIAAQSIISSKAFSHIGVPTNLTYLGPLVFIPPNSTKAIWDARIDTVAVRPLLDCGPAAASNFSNASVPLVSLDPSTFFAPDGVVNWTTPHPTFVGRDFGALGNEPTLAAVYHNASYFSGPGYVTGNASVIFLAANGTIEGAQQRITSPVSTSRIKSADVLACTATVRLEVSTCTINRGTVMSCDFNPPSNRDALSYSFGGVEKFVDNAGDVVKALAACPALAISPWYNVVPVYDITPDILSARVLPLAFMSTNKIQPPYNISLGYVRDVLFGEVMRSMVQGMLSDVDLQTYTKRQVSIISTFGASNPILACIVMALGLLIALIAFSSAYFTGNPSKFDAIRVLSLSKSPELMKVLANAAGRPEALGSSTVIYNADRDGLVLVGEEETKIDDVDNMLLISEETLP